MPADLLIRSLSISVLNLTFHVAELIATARRERISLCRHLRHQLALGAGLPLDGLRRNVLYRRQSLRTRNDVVDS